jgi:DNA-binding CsgD family transcriptional regulator
MAASRSVTEPFGVASFDWTVYRAVLREPGTHPPALAEHVAASPDRVRRALGRLVALRLVQRQAGRPGRYQPSPPDIAFAALVRERELELDWARLALPELLADYREGMGRGDPSSLVEVHAGPGVMHAKFLELVETLRSEVLVFDRQTSAEATGADEVSVEEPSLRRGVRWFGIYEQASLEIPGRLPHIQRLAAAGEQARVTRRLPMKLAIFDRQAALLPLTTSDEKRTASVVVVHPSSLLDALITLFDAYWVRSTPLRQATTGPMTAGDEPVIDTEVLGALASGFKDEAIARQLGVSTRTARRRITRLLDQLGATTRFQAGAEAAKRGLL